MSGRHLSLVVILAALTLGAAAPETTNLVQAAQQRDKARVAALVKQRADVNVASADGTTALHWAAQWGDTEMTALLLKAGAKVDAANRYDATPLWLAATNGNAAVVELLLKAGASPNRFALEGETPLLAASRSGSLVAVKALLANGGNVNMGDQWKAQTALMWAVGGHDTHPDIVSVLLEAGANPNFRSLGGMTALLFAVRQDDLESTKLLLKAGATITQAGPGGTNALLVAINNNSPELAHLLIDNGSDPNAADGSGMTPLHTVVRKRGGYGAAPGGVSGRGNETSKDETWTRGLLEALIAKGANVNARTPLKKIGIPLTIMPSSRPVIDDIESGGMTPFWLAANAGDLEAMRLLKAAGADPFIPNMEGSTALMVAAGLGYATRFTPSGRREDTEQATIVAVQQLLDWGFDVNTANEKGQTSLHGAAMAAFPKVVAFLGTKGARIDLTDTMGRTPVEVADDNRTDKYRSNQTLDQKLLEPTYEAVVKIRDSKMSVNRTGK